MNALIRALTGSGGVAKLLPLRRQITKLDQIERRVGEPLLRTLEHQLPTFSPTELDWFPPELKRNFVQTGYQGTGTPGVNYTARVVGGFPEGTEAAQLPRLREVRSGLRENAMYGMHPIFGLGGAYDDTTRVAMNFLNTPDVARHEVMHGIADVAAKSGDMSALPLPMQLAKRMQGSRLSPVKAAGDLWEEAIAHQVGGQMSARDFLLSGHDEYADGIAETSPLVAALYRRGPMIEEMAPAVGKAAKYGTAAGIGLGAGYALSDT